LIFQTLLYGYGATRWTEETRALLDFWRQSASESHAKIDAPRQSPVRPWPAAGSDSDRPTLAFPAKDPGGESAAQLCRHFALSQWMSPDFRVPPNPPPKHIRAAMKESTPGRPCRRMSFQQKSALLESRTTIRYLVLHRAGMDKNS
jgi:hypothetical protein